MSDFHNAKTEESTVEEDTVSAKNGKSEEGNESPTRNMHLQLTVDGDEESKEIIKGFETQESPQHNANEKFDKWKEYKTQESPVLKANEDLTDFRAHRTEEDQNQVEIQGSISGPPADFTGSKTIDDELKPSVCGHRGMKTVEEEYEGYEPSYPAFPAPKVIWKLLDVRPHAKNTEPVSKMIHLLPAEGIIKSTGQWALFGRGENVDVYLHDLLSSRKHADFTITKDTRKGNSQRFIATMRNKSDTKKIKINGNRELRPGEVCELHNNDQISIGVFTFLIELVPGDIRSEKFELKFLNIIPTTMQTQGYLRSIYAVPDDTQRLVVQPGMPSLDMRDRMAAFHSHHLATPSMPFPSLRIASPSHPIDSPGWHRQPVENADDEYESHRVAQENDESSVMKEKESPPSKEK